MKKVVLLSMLTLIIHAAVSQTLSDTIKLSPIEITDYVLKKVPYLKNQITGATLEDMATIDLGDAMRSIPNVSGIKRGGANIDPVVRGFKYSQLNVNINNGIYIEGGCPNRMDPVSSRVDVDDIEKVEVYKGPYALRFGPVFGSVVNMLTYQPVPYENFQLHVKATTGYLSNWNGYKEHLQINFGNKYVYALLLGNYMKAGDYIDGDNRLINSSFTKYSYTAKLGFSPWKKHSFILSYSGMYGRNIAFPALQMDEREDNTSLYSIDYAARNLSKIINSITARVYYSTVNHIMDNKSRSAADTVAAITDVDANTLGARAEINLSLKNNMVLITGLSYMDIKKNGDRIKNMIMQPVYNGMIPRKVEDIWKNADLANYGFFAEYKAAFGTWNIFAGLRLDYNMASSDPVLLYGAVPPGTPPPLILDIQNTSSSHFNVSGSLGASKKLGKFFELDLAVGRGVRSPNMVERFIILLPVSFDNYEYYGNPQLKPEVNYEGDLTFKFLHPKAGDFGLTGFYSYVQDFINGKLVPSSVQKPLSQSVLGVKQFINYDQAWFTGFEFSWALSATYKLGAAVTAAYTYGVYPKATKYVLDPTKIPSQQIVGEEEVKNDAIPEIPPFEANFRLSYRFLKDKLIPRISYRMVLSQNHVSSAYYESKTPGFNIFGASLTYRPNKYISVVGGVNNIFNVDYYEHLNRRTQGTLINLYEPGRVFFVNLTFNI